MKKTTKSISILLVAILLFSIMNSVVFGSQTSINTNIVIDNDIKGSINHFISLDTDFFGYNISDIVISENKQPYYDADNNIIAYCVTINERKSGSNIGYVVVGATYDMPTVIEAGSGTPPQNSLNEVLGDVSSKYKDCTIQSTSILYGGPFQYYAQLEIKDKQNKVKRVISNLKTREIYNDDFNKDFLKKPQISDDEKKKFNKSWKDYSGNLSIISYNNPFGIEIAFADTQPPPPTSGYTQLSYSLISDNIQYSKGWPYYLYGCGPAAGTILLYHLAQRNSSYQGLLKDANNNPITTTTMFGELLNDMSAIGGTTNIEFSNGLFAYEYRHNTNTTANQFKYKGTSLGGGANTTLNSDVWDFLKQGIGYGKPVAVGIGNKTTSGSSYYIEGNIPSGYEFHWVVASGYKEDADYNWYFKSKSWGSDYYCSFNSLCYWRDALVSTYLDASY